jgi:uncharacterized protein YggE
MNTNEKIKQVLMISAALALIAGGAAALWYTRSYSQSIEPLLTGRSFSISAEGRVVAVPDVAQLTLSVISENGDLVGLQKENTEKVNNIIAFIKSKGVDAKDIKTQSYIITPRYQYCTSGSCPPPSISGYSVTQSVSVKIRDFALIGDIIAGIVERGANSVSGPYFAVDDPTELENQARREAIEKAKARAKAIAEAGGFRLGPLLSISEYPSYPIPYSYGGRGGGGAEFAVPAPLPTPAVEPGSQEIKVNVQLTYSIK